MLTRVFYRNEIIETAAAAHLLTSATLYGRGIFTTVAIHDGRPFQWDLHWLRLRRDAATVGLNIDGCNGPDVLTAVMDVASANDLENGRVRISFLDTSAGWVGTATRDSPAEMVITASEFRSVPERLRLCISQYWVNSRSPLAGVKSCNYLDNLLAYEAARAAGCDEAIRLNERSSITSACMANVFWAADGRVFTPALSTGCLAGTTRSYIIDSFAVSEVEAGPNELQTADSIFLTSAGVGVAEVGEFEGRALGPVPARIAQSIKRGRGSVRP
jgi:branched-subunit amino acid aminotransferase/4-amino-4-deoxychorismate lyase